MGQHLPSTASGEAKPRRCKCRADTFRFLGKTPRRLGHSTPYARKGQLCHISAVSTVLRTLAASPQLKIGPEAGRAHVHKEEGGAVRTPQPSITQSTTKNSRPYGKCEL